jgi:hypothetical protein
MDNVDIKDLISKIVNKAPLSKFEIEPQFVFTKCFPKQDNLYCYSITNSYSYMRNISYNDHRVRILSPIKVDFKESDYE